MLAMPPVAMECARETYWLLLQSTVLVLLLNPFDLWHTADLCWWGDALAVRVMVIPLFYPGASCSIVPLSLVYFLFARECWMSSLFWMVMVPTTRTLGRAWLPSAISMMMGSQVSAFSLKMSVGLSVLPVSSLGSC